MSAHSNGISDVKSLSDSKSSCVPDGYVLVKEPLSPVPLIRQSAYIGDTTLSSVVPLCERFEGKVGFRVAVPGAGPTDLKLSSAASPCVSATDSEDKDPLVKVTDPSPYSHYCSDPKTATSSLGVWSWFKGSLPKGTTLLDVKSSGKAGTVIRVRVLDGNYRAATAGGVFAAVFKADPSSATEWSSFALLFDEVKTNSMRFTYAMVNPNTLIAAVVPNWPMMAVGWFYNNTSSPTGEDQVLTSTRSHSVQTYRTNQFVMKIPESVFKGNLWASTSSPAPGPYAGCPGSIQCYASGFVASQTFGWITVEKIMTLRGRI